MRGGGPGTPEKDRDRTCPGDTEHDEVSGDPRAPRRATIWGVHGLGLSYLSLEAGE